MRPSFSLIERWPPGRKVRGSNPLGRTTSSVRLLRQDSCDVQDSERLDWPDAGAARYRRALGAPAGPREGLSPPVQHSTARLFSVLAGLRTVGISMEAV
jgi:hypothetical protein